MYQLNARITTYKTEGLGLETENSIKWKYTELNETF